MTSFGLPLSRLEKSEEPWKVFVRHRSSKSRGCKCKPRGPLTASFMKGVRMSDRYGAISDEDEYESDRCLELNAVESQRENKNNREECGIFALEGKVKKMPRPLCIDSGAAKSVMPSTWLPEYVAKESEASKAGVYYVAANGEKLPDKGEKCLNVITDEGMKRTMKFAVADVTKALGSVGEICATGQSGI